MMSMQRKRKFLPMMMLVWVTLAIQTLILCAKPVHGINLPRGRLPVGNHSRDEIVLPSRRGGERDERASDHPREEGKKEGRPSASSSLSLFSFPFSPSAMKRGIESFRVVLSVGIWVHLVCNNFRNVWVTLWSLVSAKITIDVARILLQHTGTISVVHSYGITTTSSEADDTTCDTKHCSHPSFPTDKPTTITTTLYGLNVPIRKFRAWVGYHQLENQQVELSDETIVASRLHFFLRRQEWQKLWRQGRLLVDPTYMMMTTKSANENNLHNAGNLFLGVLRDEASLGKDSDDILLHFLQKGYGRDNTTKVQAEYWSEATGKDQIEAMQQFLEWFRSTFPYYYNNCKACGTFSTGGKESSESFLGISYPNDHERTIGRATHVEYFRCLFCEKVTKFPRFNAAQSICNHRRGRSGEYSHLLFAMLQALGHKHVRYVVDCGNGHVWVEVERTWKDDNTTDMADKSSSNNTTTNQNATTSSNRQWLHLDPCEAAVDKKLLYQEWGRSITSVFAFYYNPMHYHSTVGETSQRQAEEDKTMVVPIIEDVTNEYRSQSLPSWRKWRQTTIDKESSILGDKISALNQRENEAVAEDVMKD